MIITIDGPAGTGKSTVAREAARRLGFAFLNTGAMYRAVALATLRAGVDPDDPAAVAGVAERVRVDFDWSADPPRVRLDGQPVDALINEEAVSQAASRVAVVAEVRRAMVREQQRVGRERGGRGLVTEGRDQGSAVFPDAEFKFFVDASPQERARRRVEQLHQMGEPAEYEHVLREIIDRDRRDSGRAVGPLTRPAGAVLIDTTGLSAGQVVDRIVGRVRAGSHRPEGARG